MDKTVFEIKQMDCAAEEQLVRMQLEPLSEIEQLQFDLNQRQVTVYHDGGGEQIQAGIERLNLGMRLISAETVTTSPVADEAQQRKLLWIVLLINFGFFIAEMTYGLLSSSMGLVADSLDMLADAVVYSLSLFAVGGTALRKKSIAKWSGFMQLGLALLGLSEVVRRFFGGEAFPDFRTMIIVSILALAGNVVCLVLLQRSSNNEAHMQASKIFTSNDVVINGGVIVAGIMVYLLNSRLPDLLIGTIVFVIVLRGALRILQLAK